MNYVQAPDDWTPAQPGMSRSIFMAGAITGAPEWQDHMAEMLKAVPGEDHPWTLINPRHTMWDIPDDEADRYRMANTQINWEFDHLTGASACMFWFPKDALAPITLYELGSWSMTNKKMFVGVEPGYWRSTDVHIQTGLKRPEVEVFDHLEKMAEEIATWIG